MLGKNWRIKSRRKQRLLNRLLLVEIFRDKIIVTLLNKQGIIWVQTSDFISDFQENFMNDFTNELRKILLTEQVEEDITCLFLLSNYYLYEEKFCLPKLKKSEILKTMQWEIEQQLSWQPKTYNLIIETINSTKEEMELQVYALPKKIIQELINSASSLQLNLQGILNALTVADVQKMWWDGLNIEGFLNNNLNTKDHFISLLVKYSKLTLKICLIMSALFYISLKLGIWWEKNQIMKTEQQLEQLADYKKVYVKISDLEHEVEKANTILANCIILKEDLSKDIEVISRAIVQGCWLERIYKDKENIELKGKSFNLELLQQFILNLEKTQYFADVKLQNSSSGEFINFTINIKTKVQTYEK